MKSSSLLTLHRHYTCHAHTHHTQAPLYTLPPRYTHHRYTVRSVFWGISKAFGKVWYEWLGYKLCSIRISDKSYKSMENYLSNRFQQVVLNGETSLWRPILAGASQGSILEPLTICR